MTKERVNIFIAAALTLIMGSMAWLINRNEATRDSVMTTLVVVTNHDGRIADLEKTRPTRDEVDLRIQATMTGSKYSEPHQAK